MNPENLTKLGLTSGESKVYLALLRLGSSTVGPIVKESKIAYSNIYEVLERLVSKGLVTFIMKQKTKYFQAAQPNRIEDYIKNKEKEIQSQKQTLQTLLPELNTILIKNSAKTNAEIYTGTKGLKTAYEYLVSKTEKEDEIFFFNIYEEKYAKEIDFFYNNIYPLTKKMKARGLVNKDYKKSWFIKKTKFNIKFVDLPIPGNIDIVKNKILITSWHPEITAILIESESIAKHFRNYFEQIWKIAR